MIHHVAFEVPKRLQALELEFWSLIGFGETSPSRRGRRETRWLVGHGAAVEIRLRGGGAEGIETVSHVCVEVGSRGFAKATSGLEAFGHDVEPAASYFGNHRAFARSPAGHYVELLEGSPSHKAGTPLETGEEHQQL